MKQFVTSAIVLRRTNFGEADRIITVLTPDHGKLRLMAKGARRMKSKLAGGIDLFSVSDLTVLPGKGDIGTLVSSRMQRHYGEIVKDLNRTQLGYELIKQLDKITEDAAETDYFAVLDQVLAGLNDAGIDMAFIRLWFDAQLLRLGGHSPNLRTDTASQPLDASKRYKFDFDDMAFTLEPRGHFNAKYIKFLRLVFSPHSLVDIAKVQGADELLKASQLLIQTMFTTYIPV